MNEVIKVAVVQMACENGNVPRNLRHAEKFVERAATQGAELVLLPELTPNGFIMTEALWQGAELELPRFGGHVTVLVSDSVCSDFIDLIPQRGLPPPGGRSSGSMPLIFHAPAHS